MTENIGRCESCCQGVKGSFLNKVYFLYLIKINKIVNKNTAENSEKILKNVADFTMYLQKMWQLIF